MRALVIGGAGYLGSHVVRGLLAIDCETVVLDNFSTGHRESIPEPVPVFDCDAGLILGVEEVLRQYAFDLVIHCASLVDAARSLEQPFPYYHNNFLATYFLLQTLVKANVRKFLLSSDFSVYGPDIACPITERTPKNPKTPQGRSLLATEGLLEDLANAGTLAHAIIRVGNIGGALPEGGSGPHLGQGEGRLLPKIFAVALGKQPRLPIQGRDLPTADGSPVRDFVHIADVVDAYQKTVRAFQLGIGSREVLLGTGRPASVRELVATVEQVTHREVPTETAAPRPFEPPSAYADPGAAADSLRWQARGDLRQVVESEWLWRGNSPAVP
jgi:UDP-glucose 4-epimerase